MSHPDSLTAEQSASANAILAAMRSGDVDRMRAANRASRDLHGDDVHEILKGRAVAAQIGR